MEREPESMRIAPGLDVWPPPTEVKWTKLPDGGMRIQWSGDQRKSPPRRKWFWEH